MLVLSREANRGPVWLFVEQIELNLEMWFGCRTAVITIVF